MKKFIVIIFSLVLCCILTGCRTTKELESMDFANIEKLVEYRDRYLLDSIFIRDSVTVFVKGDTVIKDRWRDRWRDRIIKDTVYINKTDTMYIEKEVVKEQTEPPNNWKETLLIIIIAILIFKFK